MKTLKIDENAWMVLTLIKVQNKNKNYSETIKTLYNSYKELIEMKGLPNEK